MIQFMSILFLSYTSSTENLYIVEKTGWDNQYLFRDTMPSGMFTSSRGTQGYKIIEYIAIRYQNLKEGRDGAHQIASGKLFQTLGAKYGMYFWPIDFLHFGRAESEVAFWVPWLWSCIQVNLEMTDHCMTDFCIWRTIYLVPVRCISSIRHMYTTDIAYDGPIFLVPLSLSYPSSPVVIGLDKHEYLFRDTCRSQWCYSGLRWA